MALDADAVLTAIRDVIQEAHGNLRTITADTYEGDLYGDLDPNAQSTRAVHLPRAEASITSMERHEDSPGIMGSYGLLRLEIEVQLVRHLNAEHKLSNATRDDVKALAYNDADKLRQALMYPGNLTTTAGGTATGIVSGFLNEYLGSEAEVELADDGPGRITTTHSFACVVNVSQATS